jgi:hypothetical protein
LARLDFKSQIPYIKPAKTLKTLSKSDFGGQVKWKNLAMTEAIIKRKVSVRFFLQYIGDVFLELYQRTNGKY